MPMEEAKLGRKSAFIRPSSSFRLRSSSLNSVRLRRIFDVFDKNGDNMITLDELSQVLDLLGLEAELSDIKSTMDSYLKPGNTALEFDDFVALHQTLGDAFYGTNEEEEDMATCGSPDSQKESDLTEAFKVFDEDGDGFISAKELQVVLKKLGLPEWSEMDRVQKMIFSVDRNNDGRVDFYEFKDMMGSVLVSSS